MASFNWFHSIDGRDIPGRENRRTITRSHPVIAIATVILVGFGVKLTFFSTPKAAADAASTGSVDVSVLQTKMFPVQKIHDMTFVFSDGD